MKISIKMGNYEAILDMDFVKLKPINSNVKLDGEDLLISIKDYPGNPESFAEVTIGTCAGQEKCTQITIHITTEKINMKISELIKELQEFMTRHGDINATVNGMYIDSENLVYDEESDELEISEVW